MKRFVTACIAGAALASLAGAAGSASLPGSRSHVGRSERGSSGRPYVVGVRSLRLREHVTELAADGNWVAVSSGGFGDPAGCNVSFWHPRTRTVRRVPAVDNCDSLSGTPCCWGSLAFAGTRAAWVEQGGGISRWQSLFTALNTKAGDRGSSVFLGGGCCAPLNPWEGSHLGDVVGGGKLLVFSTWTAKCIAVPCSGATLTSQAIWRIVDGIFDCGANLNHPTSPDCVEIAQATGPLKPLDVDGGRIVVLRGDRAIELRDASGQTLRAFRFTSEQPLAAVLSGRSLSVLVQARLDTYDTKTGALLTSWPLPDVPSGGHCRNVGEPCPSIRLELKAAAKGVILYVLDRTVHLLRLSDGRDVAFTRAAAADLTGSGLFYASTFGGPYRGRVRFIPYAELPLRAAD